MLQTSKILLVVCLVINPSFTVFHAKATGLAKRDIGWQPGNWAMACDFRGNDLVSKVVPGELCGGTCAATNGCTHFTWTSFNGGTCWMKQGNVQKSDAFEVSDRSFVCGIVSGGGGGISWQIGDWAMGCDFQGDDLVSRQIPGEQCGGACASTSGCTHFTWTSFNRGTCWMKQGPVQKSDAIVTSDKTFVCGIVASSDSGHSVRLRNNCAKQIIASSLENGAGKTKESWTLQPGQDTTKLIPNGWGGRFWARYSDVGQLDGWPQPDSLAEILFDGWQGLDFYDISLVDGFGVPLTMAPVAGTFQGTCKTIVCQADLISRCPEELKLKQGGRVVACQSACTKFHSEEYCCTGSHNKPETCPQNNYGKIFKNACPDAYSYAFDDATSTFTCKSAPGKSSKYIVQFC